MEPEHSLPGAGHLPVQLLHLGLQLLPAHLAGLALLADAGAERRHGGHPARGAANTTSAAGQQLLTLWSPPLLHLVLVAVAVPGVGGRLRRGGGGGGGARRQ